MICLDCRKSEYELWHTIDFCDNTRCYSSTVTSEQRDYLEEPHLPSHDFVKIRSCVHWRDLIDVTTNAVSALDQFRGIANGDASEDEDNEDNEEDAEDAPKDVEVEADDADSDWEDSPSAEDGEAEGVDQEDEGEEEDKPRISNCFACHSPTEQPCWYCTICTGKLIFDFDVARITQNLTF